MAPVSSRTRPSRVGQLLDLALGQAGRRLVEQQHPGLEGERAHELAHAAGAGGQLGDERVGVAGQPEGGEQLVGPTAPLGLGAALPRRAQQRRPGADRHGVLLGDHRALADGEPGEEGGVLERAHQAAPAPLVRGQVADVVAGERAPCRCTA